MTAIGIRLVRYPVVAAVTTLMLAAHASFASAQYFGRNQVQYESFNFRVLKSPHFDIYFYPETEATTRDAARMAERWYARFSQLLNYQFEERQPLIIFANHPDFQQNNVVGNLGEGVQGATEIFKRRIVMPYMHSYAETDHLIGHELVHAFQQDIAGFGEGVGLEAAARRYQVPLWFSEGMAEYLSGGPIDAEAALTLRDAALSGRVPSIEQMTQDPRYFPYTWGHALWAYIGGRWGDAVIGQILKQAGQGVPYPEAFQRILNISLEELSDEFELAVRRAYLPLLSERRTATEIGDPLITEERSGGMYNLGPVLSPDGQRVAFLSELEGLDIALYVADAETGEVVRKLVEGAAFDPHFGSLRFINSAGTWSPDGRRFAFAALRGGGDVLVILDVERADVLREYRVGEVGEITNPTWSPDGRRIVFSGLSGGTTDLYVLDLETGESRRLTNDRYADLHPAFAPDGRTVAFVTDRGPGTDFDLLTFAPYRIALMDIETGQIRLAPAMQGNNVNPAWGPDGNAVYFVSDRTGIYNIYRLDLGTGELYQVTDLFGGVKGITPLSPTITVAREGGRLLFTAYEEGFYNIYALRDPAALAGVLVPVIEVVDTAAPVAALLPPIPRPTEAPFLRVAEYVSNPAAGLPPPAADTAYPVVAYNPSLSLDYLGQPQVGVSVGGAFGRTGFYGGIAGIFSDMLGRHTLFTAVQAQGQFDEIGFATVYLYRRNRWNFGAAAQRIPYVFPFVTIGRTEDPSIFRQQYVRARYFDNSIQGLAQYPFSSVQRLEFSAAFRRFSQDFQIFERLLQVDQFGRVVAATDFSDRDENVATYNLFESSAALVYDNALFGFTAPFTGQRYRFEVSPTLGDLKFVQALADYRRYLWLRPFTLAVRGLHFGQYGDSFDVFGFGRGSYLGFPSLIRGYTGMGDECQERATSCDVLTQLYGTRLALINAEIRFPLIRALVLSFGNIGIPPIDGHIFYDAGVAWDEDTSPVFARGLQEDVTERGILTSAGVGTRVNLFGYFILEIDYVNGFARERGWHWQFALQPGF